MCLEISMADKQALSSYFFFHNALFLKHLFFIYMHGGQKFVLKSYFTLYRCLYFSLVVVLIFVFFDL